MPQRQTLVTKLCIQIFNWKSYFQLLQGLKFVFLPCQIYNFGFLKLARFLLQLCNLLFFFNCEVSKIYVELSEKIQILLKIEKDEFMRV